MNYQSTSVQVRVPASTSNLGAGFDCFGLALKLYLTVKTDVDPELKEPYIIETAAGEHNAALSRSEDNLTYRAMVYAGERENSPLPSVRLYIDNKIPVSRGLGGSAAAIIAGLKTYQVLCKPSLSDEQILRYATELEGHPDNAAPSLFGGFVVNCTDEAGEVLSLRSTWPSEIKIILVVPSVRLDTKEARALLPDVVSHREAVFNLQRAALFVTALTEKRYDLLWEAMQDRLHQQNREHLVSGLAEVLATPRSDGLLGVALSGAGPSVVGLVDGNVEEIGRLLAGGFERNGVRIQILQLEIDTQGCRVI
jgi:homoserine kinase